MNSSSNSSNSNSNSNSSLDLENDVFLPSTPPPPLPPKPKPSLFSTGLRFLKKKKLHPVSENETTLYSDIVKKNEFKRKIEGETVVSDINYTKKAKSYPEESKNKIVKIISTGSISNELTNSSSPLPKLTKSEGLKLYYNLKRYTKYIGDNADIRRDLKEYEVGELEELIYQNRFLDKIYYLAPSSNFNFISGVCDEHGHYISHTYDHILYRYKTLDILGKGSYGTVLKCYDLKHKYECALKIVKSTHKYKDSMRKEMCILQRLNDTYEKYKDKGITPKLFTNFLKTFLWRGHGIIVFQLYNKDLYHSHIGKVNRAELKIIMRDLFGALIFMKRSKVIHCDLKPENIMFLDNHSFHVVIGDFGLSKINDQNKPQTDFNVQTCWYRSPEVVMHIPYSYECDLWSIGAILIELIIDFPIFKANTDKDLYYLFIKLIGDNPGSMVIVNPELRNFTIMGEHRIKLDKHIDKVVMLLNKYIYKGADDLINGIIVWDPKKRLSLEKCFELASQL
jgi:hypothetical protein